ncbi:MAG: hypothetical protein LBR33_01150 [Propionibacteriaceae bacterium]|jgi:hypothetical protein|nr:hypothetical protein [Propionibacteriaceae bacterium]
MTPRSRGLAAALAVVTLLAGAATAGAWWSDRAAAPVGLALGDAGLVGFGLTRLDGGNSPPVTLYATGPDSELAVTLTPEAVTLVRDGGLAVPFLVEGRADGPRELSYTLSPPDPATAAAGTVLHDADVRLFRVRDAAECAVDAAAGEPAAALADLPLVDAAATTGSATWCLSARWTGLPAYANTATATGSGWNGQTVTAESTWTATVTPPAVGAETWTLAVTHAVA